MWFYCSFLKRMLTGMKNLEEVEYLEMKVDTRDNSLGNFGKSKHSYSKCTIYGPVSAKVYSCY